MTFPWPLSGHMDAPCILWMDQMKCISARSRARYRDPISHQRRHNTTRQRMVLSYMDSSYAQDPFLTHRTHAAELYLIRHGDAIPDEDEIIPGGIYDNLPLSKLGRNQAQALAKRLQTRHFDAAYSSPLKRCLETSAPLLEAVGLQATII